MKKFFSVVILASIVFALNIQNVEARDIYCGTYDSGYDAYLITETILSGENDYEGFIKCKVKALSGNSVIYLDYYFEYGEGGTVAFKNSPKCAEKPPPKRARLLTQPRKAWGGKAQKKLFLLFVKIFV